MPNKNVLIACYGGGHVKSLIPVALALQEYSLINLTVLGFTTARAAFEQAGVVTSGYQEVARYMEGSCASLVPQFVKGSNHPDVTDSETFSYFHVGLHDLIGVHGEEMALQMVRERGRSVFYPEKTMAQYLKATCPDLLITSTSPRSELALQRAASEMGIPGLAVSDLFLTDEAESYLCQGRYASDMTLLCDYVAEVLRKQGGTHPRLHVTGNPAFDTMFSESSRSSGQIIRTQFGLDPETRLITWFCNSVENRSSTNEFGIELLDNTDVIRTLQAICAGDSNLRLAIRPHPNLNINFRGADEDSLLLGQDYSIEGVLWASNAVVVENSTVGLQAAMIGRQTFTIGPAAYQPYIDLGIATHVPSLNDLESALAKKNPSGNRTIVSKLGLGLQANATARVLRVIDRMLNKESSGLA